MPYFAYGYPKTYTWKEPRGHRVADRERTARLSVGPRGRLPPTTTPLQPFWSTQKDGEPVEEVPETEASSSSLWSRWFGAGKTAGRPTTSSSAPAVTDDTCTLPEQLLAVATERSITVWSAERRRRLLGVHTLSAAEAAEVGTIVALEWGPAVVSSGAAAASDTALVASVTDRGVVCLWEVRAGTADASEQRLLLEEEARRMARALPGRTCLWGAPGDALELQYLDDDGDDTAPGTQPPASMDNHATPPSSVASTATIRPVADVRLAHRDGTAPSLATCNAGVLVGTATGQLECIGWSGDKLWIVDLNEGRLPRLRYPPSAPAAPPDAIVSMHYCAEMALCGIVFRSGRAVLLPIEEHGRRRPPTDAPHARPLPLADVTAVALEPRHALVACGLGDGSVRILHDETLQQERNWSLAPWYFSERDTGPVHCLAWSPDGDALAVGWRYMGLAVWSRSGCRLWCSLTQLGAPLPSPRASPASHRSPCSYFHASPASLAWDASGLALYAAGRWWDAQRDDLFVEVPLVRCVGGAGGSGVWEGGEQVARPCFLGTDSVLLLLSRRANVSGDVVDAPGAQMAAIVSSSADDGACVAYSLRDSAGDWWRIPIPDEYLHDDWPPRHLALSDDASQVAVSGRRRLLLYSLRHRKWRAVPRAGPLADFCCIGLGWYGPYVVVAGRAWKHLQHDGEEAYVYYSGTGVVARSVSGERPTDEYALLFHRRSNSSRMDGAAASATSPAGATHSDTVVLPLPGRPLKIDIGPRGYLYVYTSVCTMQIYRLRLTGNRRAHPTLSWVLVGSSALRLDYGVRAERAEGEWLESFKAVPRFAAAYGEDAAATFRFVLPMGSWPGSMRSAAATIGATTRCPPMDTEGMTTTDRVCHPLVMLGSRGTLFLLDALRNTTWVMARGVGRFWFSPASTACAPLQQPFLWMTTDDGVLVMYPHRGSPERWFEFDPEVFMLGVLAEGRTLIGVAPGSERDSALEATGWPCHLLQAKASPVVHMLLRHQLEHDDSEAAALQMALQSARDPQFMDALEWLLHSAVDGGEGNTVGHNGDNDLFAKIVSLLRCFGEYEDVVVRCARKMDAKRWPRLFALTGDPATLLEQCFLSGRLHTAACLLVIMQEMHGSWASEVHAQRLFQAALHRDEWELAGELRLFLLRAQLHGKEAGGNGVSPGDAYRQASTAVPTADALILQHASRLLDGLELARLAHFARWLRFPLCAWLRREASTRVLVPDLYYAIASARQQFRLPEPSPAQVQQAIARWIAVGPSPTDVMDAGATAAEAQLPLSLLLQAALDAECDSLALVAATLLLRVDAIVDTLRRGASWRSAYLAALGKFEQPAMDVLADFIGDIVGAPPPREEC